MLPLPSAYPCTPVPWGTPQDTAGTITQKTLLDQLAEGEVLGDDFDVQEELEATEAGGLIDSEPPQVPEPSEMPEPEEQPEEAE